MCALVPDEVALHCERVATALNVADEWPLALVRQQVSDEAIFLSERLAATLNIASEGSLFRLQMWRV